MRHIGFTGTRHGMSVAQWSGVTGVIDGLPAGELVGHHGDCIGADADFHEICKVSIGMPVEVHPGPLTEHSACCVGDVRHEHKPHMQRNRDIVKVADVMIAAPLEMTEQDRGGTWATIRMTRKARKPLYIVWRDGTVTKEHAP